jgi:hypothetical protein
MRFAGVVLVGSDESVMIRMLAVYE